MEKPIENPLNWCNAETFKMPIKEKNINNVDMMKLGDLEQLNTMRYRYTQHMEKPTKTHFNLMQLKNIQNVN